MAVALEVECADKRLRSIYARPTEESCTPCAPFAGTVVGQT